MITEVERAQVHLWNCSHDLGALRRYRAGVSLSGWADRTLLDMQVAASEQNCLAALSWLWDAQQRAIIREGEDELAAILRARQDGPPTRARACR